MAITQIFSDAINNLYTKKKGGDKILAFFIDDLFKEQFCKSFAEKE